MDSPVIITVAKSPNRDLEGLPHWVQCILHHLCLVADGEAAEGHKERQRVRKKKQKGKKKKGLWGEKVKWEQS